MNTQSHSLLNLSNQAIASTVSEFISSKKENTYFAEYEIKGLLKKLGFQIPNSVFICKDKIGQIYFTSSLRYPLSAKISSSKISSKSDLGGVILDIKNEVELKMGIEKLSTIESCEGVLVEEMAPRGIEVIIGAIRDNQFGPVVMFGMGGLYVELYKDAAFALAPADEKDALWLIKQIKGYKILKGYRNKPPVDIPALVEMITAVSKIIASNLLVEIELNPVVLYPKGALVLDAKMFI